MRGTALALPSLRHWPLKVLQRVLPPDTDAIETRDIKAVSNWETQHTYRNDLRMFCALLVGRGYLTVNPAEEVRADKREKQTIR